ncbi:MAG: HAD family hydrolase [candidate division Zixibacteria bacterium]|nr:HAD family hydrolase [candidate division Zixibacteria bacterium]
MTSIAGGVLESPDRRPLAPPDGGRFAAIIFDMGSTLLEYENVPWAALYPSCVGSVHSYLERRRRPKVPSFEEFLNRFRLLLEVRRKRIREECREYRIGDLLRQLLRSCDIRTADGELARISNAYYAPIRRQLTVYPDGVTTLKALRDAGYRLGLLSNTCFRAQDHREELIRFGLWPLLDVASFTSTGTYRKPHPEPFRQVAKRLDVPPGRCLYVGDRQVEDVHGPQGAGMAAVLVRRPGRAYESGLTRSIEIEQVGQLPDLLGCRR